jgi:hypothetical protein
MLVFHRFKNGAIAERFAKAATQASGLRSVVCRNHRKFDAHEVFPFELSFPVALVDRAEMDEETTETAVIKLVSSFGGQFAGT